MALDGCGRDADKAISGIFRCGRCFMKFRVMIRAVLAVSLLAATTNAGYWNSPGWEDNPQFTHQVWEFGTAVSPVLADVDSNPFGAPKLGVHGANVGWRAAFSGREGVWLLEPGWAQIEGIVHNEANEELVKEVWIQATLTTDIPGEEIPIELGFEFPAGSYCVTAKDSRMDPAGGDWFYLTAMFEIDPQPSWEVVSINISVPSNAYVAVDRLAVDTRGIPEPSTLILLSLGGFAMKKCGDRRRRQN